jgi:UDP-N-acetylglucosamine--N-acetylmuramyl-(pentapeptide) pyrophosphoryl-undecaprenol N-acetylglucosamine transferase
VLGVGGYASGPVLLAAALARYPTAILEQNTVPGFTNRALGPLVRAVFTAFPAAHTAFPGRKIIPTGNPLRRAFLQAAAAATQARAKAAPTTETAPSAAGHGRLLVVGGSQGSRAVNDRMVEAAGRWARDGALPNIVHQTGPADAERVSAAYAALGLLHPSPADRAGDPGRAGTVQVQAFIDDMAAACSRADLVVARAGALTLAELAVLGVPAVLIPLPTAADDHQTKNAAAYAAGGAALLLPQAEATGERLAQEISGLLADAPRRRAMSAAMIALARPRAAAAIADRLEEMARR